MGYFPIRQHQLLLSPLRVDFVPVARNSFAGDRLVAVLVRSPF
ncbi:MAG: hypothetical protein WBA57_00205 [Elainellaceae cyanobacterium]